MKPFFLLLFTSAILIFGFQNCGGTNSDYSSNPANSLASGSFLNGSGQAPVGNLAQGSLVITTGSFHPVVSGHNWNFNLAVSGATGPVTWSIVSGELPVNMSLDPKAGTIGNSAKFNTYPTSVNNALAEGIYTFTVRASSGAVSTSKQFSLEVLPQNTNRPIIMDQIQPEIAINEYVYPGGPPHNSWPLNYNTSAGYYGDDSTCSLVSGQLPSGVSIQKFDGYAPCFLTGIARQVGTYKVVWKVQNMYGSDTRELTILVYNPADTVTLLTTGLPAAKVGVAYSYQLRFTTTGNPNVSQIRFSEIGSVLYSLGLTIDDRTGEISGVPTTAGNFSVGFNWGISTFAHESGSSIFSFTVNP